MCLKNNCKRPRRIKQTWYNETNNNLRTETDQLSNLEKKWKRKKDNAKVNIQ